MLKYSRNLYLKIWSYLTTLNPQHLLQTFHDYVQNTWLDGNFSINMWCHWNNAGPRTTNHAEGYHNRLNIADLRDMNLALSNFLHALQPLHNRDQIRTRNLMRGVIAPKRRDLTYVELDNRIMDTKAAFEHATGRLLCGFSSKRKKFQNPKHLKILS